MYVDRLSRRGQRLPGSLCKAFSLALLALLALGFFGLPVSAQQSALTLSDANLQLLPEYDDPGLLVIMNGTFDNLTTFPQEITLPVSAGARGLHTTEQDGDQLLVRPVSGPADGQVSYTLTGRPNFHTEYYLDREPSGNDRVIKYSWRAPYAIKNLLVTIQAPARAGNFTVSPQDGTLTRPEKAGDAPAYQIKRANLAAGDVLDFEIRYTKNDNTPSLPQNPAARSTTPNATGETSTGGSASPASAASETTSASGAGGASAPGGTPPVLPYVLIGVGLAALVTAAVYWFVERRSAPAPAGSGRGVRAPTPRPGQPSRGAGKENARFCPKCGRPFAADDRFCGQCGTPRGA